MRGPALSVGQVARVLDHLRTKGDDRSCGLGRELVEHLRKHAGGRSFSASTSESIRVFEEAAAPLAELESVKAEQRKLERQIETTRAETTRLRRGRCERLAEAAIRRGALRREARDEAVRRLEDGDESLRCALDPGYAPPMPSDHEFARQFEAAHGTWPAENIDKPEPADDPERAQVARDLGFAIEEVI